MHVACQCGCDTTAVVEREETLRGRSVQQVDCGCGCGGTCGCGGASNAEPRAQLEGEKRDIKRRLAELGSTAV